MLKKGERHEDNTPIQKIYVNGPDFKDYVVTGLRITNQIIVGRWIILLVLTLSFLFTVLSCLSFYWLIGFNIITLPEGLMYAITSASVAELVGLLLVVIKFYHSGDGAVTDENNP